MKKLILVGVVNAITSVIFGGAAAWGVIHFMGPPTLVKNESAAPAGAKGMNMADSIFISMPEILVTLHDKNLKDRYMVLELVLVANGKNKDGINRMVADEPLYQSIAVETLSNMSYEDIRGMRISQIKDLLTKAITDGVKARQINVLYEDILVKKVVFQ